MNINPNSLFDFNNKLIFDRFFSSGEYLDSEKNLLWEMLMENPGFTNAQAKHSTNRVWFENFKAAESLLVRKFQRENPQPLAGDCVYIECDNGRIYEDALIAYAPNTLNEKFVLVTQGGGHIRNVHQSPIEHLNMSVAGGYFMGVHAHEFSEVTDSVQQPFWFWAEKPCANGGLYIKRPVIRWRLKQINPNFY